MSPRSIHSTELSPARADEGPLTQFAADELAPAATRRVRIWDLPLRLFHWSLLAAVAVAIATGEVGGNWMTLHGQAGLAVVALLAFRLTWGLVGSSTARFAQFAPTPGRLAAYLRGRWQGRGHNPLGALSVFALLGVLAAQACTGLFGNDEIAFTGPLNARVDEALGLRLTGWHQDLAVVLFVLLGLHVAAIVFHRVVKKHDLVRPMVTGWTDAVSPGQAAESAGTAPAQARWRRAGGPLALSLAVAVAAAALWLASGGPWQAPVAVTPSVAAPQPAASAPAW